MSQSLINQGNILTLKGNTLELSHLINGVAIPYKSGKYSYSKKAIIAFDKKRSGVAIPYKSGKYSYKKTVGVSKMPPSLSQSLINQGNILTNSVWLIAFNNGYVSRNPL